MQDRHFAHACNGHLHVLPLRCLSIVAAAPNCDAVGRVRHSCHDCKRRLLECPAAGLACVAMRTPVLIIVSDLGWCKGHNAQRDAGKHRGHHEHAGVAAGGTSCWVSTWHCSTLHCRTGCHEIIITDVFMTQGLCTYRHCFRFCCCPSRELLLLPTGTVLHKVLQCT